MRSGSESVTLLGLTRPSSMTTHFRDPPTTVAWIHRDARTGFEVAFLSAADGGYRIEGHTTAVEAGVPWAVDYEITIADTWLTRRAEVHSHRPGSSLELLLEGDGRGGWTVDGRPAPQLDGCLDVDLEASALTNAFPVHRLRLRVGDEAEAPAAYVRAADLGVERLEQRYVREPDEGRRQCYRYAAPAFDFEARLVYDETGFVIDYPGLALRAG
jgi:hypothetical protein